ncbi:hypothetical protein NMY22_g20157 [Coprinellus aureogranulatus]|nr:hypothetical protein NMY22_g20157 [Coprinellus aureogranulatus]
MAEPDPKKPMVPNYVVGQPMSGMGIALVLRSEVDSVKPGSHVVGYVPFQNYSVLPKEMAPMLMPLDNPRKLPWSTFVGVLGGTGQTAWMAWEAFAQAKQGETAFVTTAAGAVGSIVVQIAKLAGMKVIASTGSDEKVAFVKELGADIVFNYKTTSTKEVLEKEGPIDVFWDNVGGSTLDLALENANTGARFIECGMISGYNSPSLQPAAPKNIMKVIEKCISMHGFLLPYLFAKEGLLQKFWSTMPQLVEEGKVKGKEQVYRGLDKWGQAIHDVLTGANVGKAVVVVADE